jgi:hypothetical protein
MNRQDEKFLKMLKIQPVDIATVPEAVPGYVYDELIVAHCRLDAECAIAHEQVRYMRHRLNAATEGYRRRGALISRWHRAFVIASAISAVLLVVAVIGWLR